MRIYHFKGKDIESTFIFAAICVAIAAIISGIVLFITVGINDYFYNFADIYIFYAFNFKNGSIFISRFFNEAVYLYAVFFIVRATRTRYAVLPFIAIRLFIAAFYGAVLFGVFFTEGAIVALFVFLPSCAVSLALILISAFICDGKLRGCAYALPLIFALISALASLVLLNVVFRTVIIIV